MEGPRKYMSKRQRPCDFCRSRKSACLIKSQPPCRLCQLHARSCTFLQQTSSRGRNAQHRDTTVAHSSSAARGHSSLGDLLHPPASAPAYESLDAGYTAVMNAPPTAPTPPLVPRQSGNHGDWDDSVHDLWNPFEDYLTSGLDFDPVPSPDARGDWMALAAVDAAHRSSSPRQESSRPPNLLDTDGPTTAQAAGMTADIDPFLMRMFQLDGEGKFSFNKLTLQCVDQEKVPLYFTLAQPSVFTASREESGPDLPVAGLAEQTLESLFPVESGQRLLALYNKYVAPQYPIFSQSHPLNPGHSPAYLLAAVYAIVQPFVPLDDILFVERCYDRPPYAQLSRISLKAVLVELHAPSLPVLQALLLIVLRPPTTDHVSEMAWKWSLFGTLVSTAQTLGLHQNPTRWQIPEWQIAQRRRISWLIYATDKWLACAFGKPPLLTADNWLVDALSDGDGFDAGVDPENWTYLVSLSRLTSILSASLQKLFSLRALDSLISDPSATRALAQEFQGDLLIYQSQLPHVQDRADSHKDTLALQTVCKLGYVYVMTQISRATIRPYLLAAGTGDNRNETADPYKHTRDEVRAAAREAVDFIETLNLGHANIFWPVWSQHTISSIYHFILQMALTSKTPEDAFEWTSDFQRAYQQLRSKSRLIKPLRFATLRIGSIFWKGIGNVFSVEPHIIKAFEMAEVNTGPNGR